MTLNELKYIIAVARERHFGRAAESCFISQPTLSVAVRKLEEELGTPLFERRQGEVSVTEVGKLVVAQAQRVLEEVSLIRHLAEQGQNQLAGPLRLGAIYTVGPYLLPHLIPALSERAPEMPLIIEENYTAALSEKLKAGELDVIIISQPYDESGVLTLDLYLEPFIVLLPTAHPLSQHEFIEADELGGENVLLLGAGHCFREQVLTFCPACAQRPPGEQQAEQNLEGGSLETIRYMVAGGLGITVLPCTAAGADRFSERLLTIRRFAGEAPARVVSLAWRKSFPRPEAITAVRDAILACQLSCISTVSGTGREPT